MLNSCRAKVIGFLFASMLVASPAGATPVTFGNNAYKFISGFFSFDQAIAAAQAQTFNGVSGHLVTITSASENAFVLSLIATVRIPCGLVRTTGPSKASGGGSLASSSGRVAPAVQPGRMSCTRIGTPDSRTTSARARTLRRYSAAQWFYQELPAGGMTAALARASTIACSNVTATSSSLRAQLYRSRRHYY